MPNTSKDNDDLIGMGGAHGGPHEPASGLSTRPAFREAVDALVNGEISEPRKGYDAYHFDEPAERGWELGAC